MQRSLLPARGARAARTRARRRLRVGCEGRGRRRRLRLPHARRRPARGRPRRRHRPRRRRRPPTWRWRSTSSARSPASTPTRGRSSPPPTRSSRRRSRPAASSRWSMLVFDAAAGEVACASAGHPPPRLVLPDGTVESIPARGLALGIDAPQEYETVTLPFPPGAIVVVYTDGVIEARSGGEQFGVERLDALLAERQQPAAAGDRAGRARLVPRLDRGRADRRLRRRRRQAGSRGMSRRPGSTRGARLRRRHRLARDRDRGLADAGAVLRLVDDRLGEPDRNRPRRARARLLARRQARRPPARAAAARADRPGRRTLGGDDAVRRAAVPRRAPSGTSTMRRPAP